MDELPDARYFKTILQELNSALSRFCEETGLIFLDEVYQAVADTGRNFSLKPSLTLDGAHFNYEGYERIGHAMCQGLKEEIKKDDVVLLVGDSITAGFPGYEPVLMGEFAGDEKHSFGYYLRTVLGCRVINKGISGDFTSNMVRRIGEYLAPPPDFVVLQGGANDAFSTLGFDGRHLGRARACSVANDIFGNLRAMAEMCLEQDCVVAVVPLLPFFG